MRSLLPDGTATLAGPHGRSPVAALRLAPLPATRGRRDPAPASAATVRNLITGDATTVVQAGTVAGNVYLGESTTPPMRDDRTWLRALWTVAVAVGARLELRYLTAPGGLQAFLLVRLPGAEPAQAINLVARLAAELPGHLRAQPVASGEQLRKVLDPFVPHATGVVEIRKRLTGQRTSRGDTDAPWLTAVTPWRAGQPRSWSPLFTELAGVSGRAVLSIGLVPFRIGPGLREHLKLRANEFTRLARPGPPPVYGLYEQPRPPDRFAAAAVPLLAEAVGRYTDHAFQIRVSLAADRALPDLLAARAAETISAGESGGGFLEAPAVAVRPLPGELATAWRNIAELNFDPLPGAHLQGLPDEAVGEVERVLGAIVDLDEAAAAARLPHEADRSVFPPIEQPR
ncbi:MAG TPA: hypothetical protein VG756_27735 [Pseudonocardiaceae bacterium]|nr:hypothetical protein [Pseudonocardiaceae bacterium]